MKNLLAILLAACLLCGVFAVGAGAAVWGNPKGYKRWTEAYYRDWANTEQYNIWKSGSEGVAAHVVVWLTMWLMSAQDPYDQAARDEVATWPVDRNWKEIRRETERIDNAGQSFSFLNIDWDCHVNGVWDEALYASKVAQLDAYCWGYLSLLWTPYLGGGGPLTQVGSKTALNKRINDIETWLDQFMEKKGGVLTEEEELAFFAFAGVADAAIELNDDAYALQEEIDKALQDLNSAYNTLLQVVEPGSSEQPCTVCNKFPCECPTEQPCPDCGKLPCECAPIVVVPEPSFFAKVWNFILKWFFFGWLWRR